MQLGSYKSIAADSNGVQKELKVFENNAETPEFKSAVSSLEALCVKAVTPIPNIGMPMPLDQVGPFARPFLAVVMDPRAAGPHTLVALLRLDSSLR